MPLDITEMNAPKSDQLDAVDLNSEGRVFTIAGVRRNSSPDQPLNVDLEEFPRVWRPSKSMRRVLAHAWGADAEQYVGRRVHLYTDPEVEFGGQKVGGVRIRAMSNIAKPVHAPLLIKKGRAGLFTVQPLKDAPAPATEVDLDTVTDLDALRGMWKKASPERRQQIEARIAGIKAEDEAGAANEPADLTPEPFDGTDPWAGDAA